MARRIVTAKLRRIEPGCYASIEKEGVAAAEAVAEKNEFLDEVLATETFSEAMRAVLLARTGMRLRASARIPLP